MGKEPKRAPVRRKTDTGYFGLAEQGTDVRTEFIVGVTTFLTTVHIVFVNPIILGKTGMDQGAVFASQPRSALWSWPDDRDYNAADLFDCDRHRPWLYHLRSPKLSPAR